MKYKQLSKNTGGKASESIGLQVKKGNLMDSNITTITKFTLDKVLYLLSLCLLFMAYSVFSFAEAGSRLRIVKIPATITKIFSCSEAVYDLHDINTQSSLSDDLTSTFGISGQQGYKRYSGGEDSSNYLLGLWENNRKLSFYSSEGDGYSVTCPQAGSGRTLITYLGEDGGVCVSYSCRDRKPVSTSILNAVKQQNWSCEDQKVAARGNDWTSSESPREFESSENPSRRYSAYCEGGGSLTISANNPSSSSCFGQECLNGVVTKVETALVLNDITPETETKASCDDCEYESCDDWLSTKQQEAGENWISGGSIRKFDGAGGEYYADCGETGAKFVQEKGDKYVSCITYSCSEKVGSPEEDNERSGENKLSFIASDDDIGSKSVNYFNPQTNTTIMTVEKTFQPFIAME